MRYVLGKFELHKESRRLYFDGQLMPASQRGIDILLYLIALNGASASKKELLGVVWPGEVANEARLIKQISLLRRSIEYCGADRSIIITVQGSGYRTDRWEIKLPAASTIELRQEEVDRSPDPVAPSVTASRWPRLNRRGVAPGLLLFIPLFFVIIFLFLSIVSQVEVHSNFGPSGIISAQARGGFKRSLRFSRDGRAIAYYQSAEPDGTGQLFIVNLPGNSTVAIPGSWNADEEIAWSPDNRSVALLRSNGTDSDRRHLVLSSLDGQQVRKIAEVEGDGIDWSPSGQDLAVCERPFDNDGVDPGSVLIHLLASDGSNHRRLTRPPHQDRVVDSHPRFSPHGSQIAFFRHHLGRDDRELCLIDIASGEEVTLLREKSHITALEWSPDGTEILFISNRSGVARLWSISATKSQSTPSPDLVTMIGDPLRSFSISGAGNLAYVSLPDNNSQIDLIPLPKGNLDSLLHSLSRPDYVPCTISSGSSTYSPAFSPDGSRLAFVSNLSGAEEIWIANSRCTNHQQLTFLNRRDRTQTGGMNWLDWSDDGNRIAFTRRIDQQSDLFYLDVAKGRVYQLTDTPGDESNPVWSHDAGQIYYVWAPNQTAGVPRQIRRLNLISNQTETFVEGCDGRFDLLSNRPHLYFARKHRLWQKNLKTGEEHQLASLDEVANNENWEISRESIYLLRRRSQPWPTLSRLDLSGGLQAERVENLLDLDISPAGLNPRLAISPDGRSIASTSISLPAREIRFLSYLR